MTRKVIQLVSNNVIENIDAPCNFVLHALCDDGSMWWLDSRGSGWVAIEPVPQDEVRWNKP